MYEINNEYTWVEQKENIVTKLLPPLYKIVNKKYNATNSQLLKMLYGQWRSRHRVSNIKNQGEERVKKDKRRAKKNSRMQDVSKYLFNVKWKFLYFTITLLEEEKKNTGNKLFNRRSRQIHSQVSGKESCKDP